MDRTATAVLHALEPSTITDIATIGALMATTNLVGTVISAGRDL